MQNPDLTSLRAIQLCPNTWICDMARQIRDREPCKNDRILIVITDYHIQRAMWSGLLAPWRLQYCYKIERGLIDAIRDQSNQRSQRDLTKENE